MPLNLIKSIKPLTISALLAGSTSFAFMYDDINKSCIIPTNPKTEKYFSWINDQTNSNITLKVIFNDAYARWKQRTKFYSFSHQIIEDPDFQKIIAIGKPAVPLILEKLREQPSLIVWALNLIYQEKISNNPRTTIEDACKLWIKKLS